MAKSPMRFNLNQNRESGFTTLELAVATGIGVIALGFIMNSVLYTQRATKHSQVRGEYLISQLLLGQVARERGDELCEDLGYGADANLIAPRPEDIASGAYKIGSGKLGKTSGSGQGAPPPLSPPPGQTPGSGPRPSPLPSSTTEAKDIFSVIKFNRPDSAPNAENLVEMILQTGPTFSSLTFSLDSQKYNCETKDGKVNCVATLFAKASIADPDPRKPKLDLPIQKFRMHLDVANDDSRKVLGCHMGMEEKDSDKPSDGGAGNSIAEKSGQRAGIIPLGKIGENLGSDCDRFTLIGHWQSNAGDFAPFQGSIIKSNGKYRVAAVGTGSFYGNFELTANQQCLAYGNPDSYTTVISCFKLNAAGEILVDLGPQIRASYMGYRCEKNIEHKIACDVLVNVKGGKDSDFTLTASPQSPGPCKILQYKSQQGITPELTATPGQTSNLNVQTSPTASQMDPVISCPPGTEQENCYFHSGAGPFGLMTCRCWMK